MFIFVLSYNIKFKACKVNEIIIDSIQRQAGKYSW